MAEVECETSMPGTQGKHVLSLSYLAENGLDDENHNLMGLDKMEINMVHVLLVKFQPTKSQLSFLDDDVVAEETTQLDFVAIEEAEPISKED